MDELDNIIELDDENGMPVKFEFLDFIEYNGGEYVVLLPYEEDADEVVILRVEGYDGERESYVSVDDENELAEIFEIFKQRFADEFDFVD